MSITTLKSTDDPVCQKRSSEYGYRTSRPGFSFMNKEGDIKAPLQVHDEMKKQNQLNRIEIKTLDDEDLEEMNDCEIEVEAEDILEEEVKSKEEVFFEKLPDSDCKDPSKKPKIQDRLGDQTEDSISKFWVDELLPNMDKLKDTDKVRDMVIYQVPDNLRGKIWRSISGNPASISRDYYKFLCIKGKRIGEVIMKKAAIEKSGQPTHDTEYIRANMDINMMAMVPGESHEESIVIIENDLPRTFTTMKEYNQKTEEGQQNIASLRKILRAFTVMRPDVGYVQGMSYLAGFLFLDNTEYDTFVLFHNLVIKSQILSFYKFNADEIIQRLKFFRQAFLTELPELCEFFEEEKIDPRSYIYEWVMTLYTRALPVSVAKRVWDLYFIDGFPLLFRTALAILKILKDKILYSDISEVMNTLKNTQNIITDEAELMKVITEVELPKWVYEELQDLQVE